MNLEAILKEHNVPYLLENHHHCRPGWVQIACCPSCTPNSRRYRLGYCIRGRFLSCWSCGPQRLIPTLMELTGQPYPTVKEWVGELPREAGDFAKPRGKLVIPEGVGPMAACHRKYLKGRGFDPDEIERLWGVQGIGLASRLAWRLWIPMKQKGEVVSWTTRSLHDEGRRYCSALPEEERVSPKDLLYGMDYAGHAVAVVEGPSDVWRIGPGAVGTLGTAYSKRQLCLIARFPKRYIVFDPEPEAQKRARQLVDALSVMPGQTYNIVLESSDPGAMGEREAEEVRALLG